MNKFFITVELCNSLLHMYYYVWLLRLRSSVCLDYEGLRPRGLPLGGVGGPAVGFGKRFVGLVGLVGVGLGVGLGGLVYLVCVGLEGLVGLVGVGLGVGLVGVGMGEGLGGLVGSPLVLQHAINPSWFTHLPPLFSQLVDPRRLGWHVNW